MITKDDVMFYTALGAVFSGLFGGVMYDMNLRATALALIVISIGCLGALLLAYPHTPKEG